MIKRAPLFADEECRAERGGPERVAAPGVISERGNGGQMDRNEPGLAELGVADGQQSRVEIDILTLEPQRFTDPQSGDRKQAENAIIGPAVQASLPSEPSASH